MLGRGADIPLRATRTESKMTIQQVSDMRPAAMLGLGVYRPDRVVTNNEICETLDSTD